MPYGVAYGNNASTRIPLARTQLPIASIAAAAGMAPGVGANTFTLAALGLYQIDLDLNVSAPSNDTPFSIELYNETLGAVVQSRNAVAPQQPQPEDMWFGFEFTVANVNHEYSFYITPLINRAPVNFALLLQEINFRAVVQEFSSGGNVNGTGTPGTLPVWTLADTIGDSQVTDDGAGEWTFSDGTNQVLAMGLVAAAFNVAGQPGVDITVRGRDADTGNQNGGSLILAGGAPSGTGLRGTIQCPGAGAHSTALGEQAIASGDWSVVVGSGDAGVTYANPTASAAAAIAIGPGATASGLYGIAQGPSAQATATYGVAIGYQANSAGLGCVAIGAVTVTQEEGGIAIGTQASTTGKNSIAIGVAASAQTSGGPFFTDMKIAIGSGASVAAGAAYGIAIGYSASAFTGTGNIVIGTGAITSVTAGDERGIAIGDTATTGGTHCTAIGYSTLASDDYAIALGDDADARVAKTINVSGLSCARNDDGESDYWLYFGSRTNVVYGPEIDVLGAPADVTLAFPASCHAWIEEAGFITTELVLDGGAVGVQPTVRVGITGTPAKYLAAVAATLLNAEGGRERYTTLLADDWETSFTAGMTVAGTIVGGGGSESWKMRPYWVIRVVEDE